MTNSQRCAALFLSAPLLVSMSGCSLNTIGDLDLGCLPFGNRVSYGTITSDSGLLRAAVTCEEGSDCVDLRTIQRRAVINFVIEVPEAHSQALRVKGDPERSLEISGFSDDPKTCGDAREISGSVTFSLTGDGAFVVLSGDEEVDRFSFDVQNPASLDVQFSDTGHFGDQGDWESPEVAGLNDGGALRALVRGPSGDRLVGGPPPAWSIDNANVARFLLEDEVQGQIESATASGYIVDLVPGIAGIATVAVTTSSLASTIPVVVGSPEGLGGAAPE